MMESLPREILDNVYSFLTNDVVTITRVSLCSKALHQQITEDSNALWEHLVRLRWSSHGNRFPTTMLTSPTENTNFRLEFIRRYKVDKRSVEILHQMTKDLKVSLRVTDDQDDGGDTTQLDGNPHLGNAWVHPLWNELLALRTDNEDILRQEAQLVPASSFHDRIQQFVAARCLQNVQFVQCLEEWRRIHILETTTTESFKLSNRHFNAMLIERYLMLVDEVQQRPDQLIQSKIPATVPIRQQLDALADRCRIHIQESNLTMVEKMLRIAEYIVKEEGILGDTETYYNYRNSLLSGVLRAKKGIPMTLATLLLCICRRLDIVVHIVGLPGHVVASFNVGEEEENSGGLNFIDMFGGGNLLSLEDCQNICHSYGIQFEMRMLQPMEPCEVLERILRNLANAHLRTLTGRAESFSSDLLFNQRALASIHRQPSVIAIPYMERLTQELPLTLSMDLMRHFRLLSTLGIASDTTENTASVGRTGT